MKGRAFVLAALLTLPIGSGHAGFISWTDWTSGVEGENGIATGTISIGSTTVGVTYTGDIAFTQLGLVADFNYWSENGDPKPYTGNTVVDNAPTPYELIALTRTGITNTLTFSEPVRNPILPIVSMGQPDRAVAYDFDIPFTVLSNGVGYWSFANAGNPGLLTVSPDGILMGREAHATIQFVGTFSTISWVTREQSEYWHGITIGLTHDALIPEPTSLALFGLGLATLGAIRRKWRTH